MKLVFRVSGVVEEHAIIDKMLCPLCESPLKLELQALVSVPGKLCKGDAMMLRCTNKTCNNQIEVLFYLSEDYDAVKEMERVLGKKETERLLGKYRKSLERYRKRREKKTE